MPIDLRKTEGGPMTVELISMPTLAADDLAAKGAAICTKSDNPSRALRHALAHGHRSVSEHAAFTFEVQGVSRVLLAQLTRHRVASFSVESQRYCAITPVWIVPPTVKYRGWEAEYREMCDACFSAYHGMIVSGIPEEDARYVIPQGITCNLLVTMNARELMHFFELRCCNRAQWEIRRLAWAMLEACKGAAPTLFKDAGPSCLRTGCPEGKQTCGAPYHKEETCTTTTTCQKS